MWDVQTGGLAHTFTTKSEVNDIAVSASGGHIACGLSDGSVTIWNIYTKKEGRNFRNNQPVVAICWQSPQILAVATLDSLCIHSVTTGSTMDSLPFLIMYGGWFIWQTAASFWWELRSQG
jgi:WD40 repeat protein